MEKTLLEKILHLQKQYEQIDQKIKRLQDQKKGIARRHANLKLEFERKQAQNRVSTTISPIQVEELNQPVKE